MPRHNSQLVLLLWSILLSVALPSAVMAQSQALVHITSNDSDAAVYADSLYLGPVRGSPYRVDHRTRTITLSALRASTWNVAPVRAPLQATPGEDVHLTLNFPIYHRIESSPFGAQAWLERGSERRLLGVTPVVFHSIDTHDGTFHIEMDGHVPGIIKPGTELWNRYEITLVALDQGNQQSGTRHTARHQRRWIDWGMAAVAVVAGAVAVHYKFRADHINDRYLETGDASLRPRVARLDDYSGVALGVMQAGLVTLAVRFALR